VINAHTKATFIKKSQSHTKSSQWPISTTCLCKTVTIKDFFNANFMQQCSVLGNWKGWPARARRLVKIRFGGNK